MLTIYFNYYYNITDEEKEEMDKNDSTNLFPKGYKYNEWYK